MLLWRLVRVKNKTKTRLELAYKECRDQDKSFGYMLQYLQDKAKVDFDTAYSFCFKKVDK